MSLDLLSRARGELTQAVRTAPENGENRILLASVLSTQTTLSPDRYPKQEVREAFRSAVALDPLSPVVLVGATRGLLASGLDQDAHALASSIEERIRRERPEIAEVIVHTEP